MLIIAWMFMIVGVITTIVLLSDLKNEMRYNIKSDDKARHVLYAEGEYNELQKTDDRKYGELLCRCS